MGFNVDFVYVKSQPSRPLFLSNLMETGITPISLDGDTIAVPFGRVSGEGTDGECSQFFLSSKSTHPPPAFSSQPNFVSASITHAGTLLHPSGIPLWTKLPTPSSSSAEENDGLLATHLPQSATPSPHHSPPQNFVFTINHSLPSVVSSASLSAVPSTSEISEYFSNEVGSHNTKRISYLVKATRGFIKSASLEPATFTTVLEQWSSNFDGSGSGPIERLRHLVRGYAKIKHYFADLLYIIYFAHEIEQVAQSESRKVGKGKGRGRQTAAFSKTAEALHKETKAVTADHRKSRNYMLLLQYGGPGSLLQIGPGVDTIWQHRLIEDDIRVLLKYRKDHLQDLDGQARALNAFSSQILVAGMIAFGWSYHELTATRSDLTDSIQLHADLQQLVHDMEGEGSGTLKDGIQEKRRGSDSDHTNRPVKRVRLSQSFEDLDMSMLTGLSPMPGEQDMSMLTGLSPMPSEQDMSMLTGLSPMPGEQDMSMLTGLSPMPGELDMAMLTGLSPIPDELNTAKMTGLSPMPEELDMLTIMGQHPQAYENWAYKNSWMERNNMG